MQFRHLEQILFVVTLRAFVRPENGMKLLLPFLFFSQLLFAQSKTGYIRMDSVVSALYPQDSLDTHLNVSMELKNDSIKGLYTNYLKLMWTGGCYPDTFYLRLRRDSMNALWDLLTEFRDLAEKEMLAIADSLYIEIRKSIGAAWKGYCDENGINGVIVLWDSEVSLEGKDYTQEFIAYYRERKY